MPLYLKQSDPMWAKTTIGNTDFTLKDYGCTITSLSMASDVFGCYCPPDKLAKLLDFNSKGEILWQSVNKLCFSFDYRFYGYQKETIIKALSNPKQQIILQVNGNHWVYLQEFTERAWVIVDPLTGKDTTTNNEGYKITGGTILQGKAQIVPTWAKDAYEWGIQNEYITTDSPMTDEFTRALVLAHRIHRKGF